jgi:hypothetical protein
MFRLVLPVCSQSKPINWHSLARFARGADVCGFIPHGDDDRNVRGAIAWRGRRWREYLQ